jgi:branched-chain amino acid transport system permease protein
MVRFIESAISGFAVASTLALLALGFVLIYRATGVINFAQGDLATLGAYLGIWTTGSLGLPVGLGYLAVLPLMFAFGLLFERVAYAPLRNQSTHVVVLATLGMGMAIRAALQIWRGPNELSLKPLVSAKAVRIGHVAIAYQDILTFVVAAACVGAVAFVLAKTSLGRQLRATTDDRTAARLYGVRVNRLAPLIFGLGCLLAGVAGLLIAETTAVQLNLGFDLLLNSIAAAIIGGFGRLSGLVLGAIVVGMAEQLVGAYVLPNYGQIWPFVVMILVVAVRPNGLLGGIKGARL